MPIVNADIYRRYIYRRYIYRRYIYRRYTHHPGRIFESSNPQIFKSSNLRIFKFSNTPKISESARINKAIVICIV